MCAYPVRIKYDLTWMESMCDVATGHAPWATHRFRLSSASAHDVEHKT